MKQFVCHIILSAEHRAALNERMALIAENYNLTWPTYSDHTASMLSQMMRCNNFADVTLVCDDKKQIQAHRNVLSACSGFFKDILLINLQSVQHPVVFLRGVHSEELNTILQFVYEGQVSICQDKFTKLYEVAKSLEIVELALIIQFSMLNKDTETNTPINNESQETVSQEKNERKRLQISLAATVIYLLFTALVSTVYTLHTSRRRADRTVFSVHKTQINSTKDRGS